ncbi:MAG: aryl-sulfate sulfotransferase [Planctomycetia bacterium]|nr:aryl-sulfate sulfotransferase [Planctomycetia bacterium]
MQEFTWEGELVWDFQYGDDRRLPHHDVLKLPNGNVLLVVCERIPASEAIAAGRRPNTFTGDYFLSDCVVEIKPTGRTTGEVVWEWRVWDHLVQDTDRTKPNYGSVSEHPELIDINHGAGTDSALFQGADLTKLQGLGYVSAPTGNTSGAPGNADWTHINSVAYHPELDQIALTGLGFSEVWIIDHSTTKTEAASPGGRHGKGGALLYRWGNPRAYRCGTNADQWLVYPHHAHWIERGLPGEGNLLVFNNGSGRGEMFSSVDEIVLPVDSKGRYTRKAKSVFGPDKPTWTYNGGKKPDFSSPAFSSAQRLPNGNTLVCLGVTGTVLEVTPEGEVVWKYTVPNEMALPFDIPLPPGLELPKLPFGAPPLPKLEVPAFTLGNPLFRAPRYAPDYPGLLGTDLTPKLTP